MLSNFSSQLSQIHDSVERLDSGHNSQQSEIAALQTSSTALNARVSENREAIGEQGQRLSGVEHRIASVEQDTTTVKSDVNSPKFRITALENSGHTTRPLNFIILFSTVAIIVILRLFL